MAHFCRIPFGPRGRCGGRVRGALCALAQRHLRSQGGSAMRSPVRGPPELGRRRRRAAPWPPGPPPAGGIHSLAVAKGGGKASAEVLERPKRCWSGAWGSWKGSSASSHFFWVLMWEETQAPALLPWARVPQAPVIWKQHTHTHTLTHAHPFRLVCFLLGPGEGRAGWWLQVGSWKSRAAPW